MAQKQEDHLKIIYTLGTSNRSLKEFLDLLKGYQIEQILDVRSFPVSKRYPHFSREKLAASLLQQGISYFWLGKELGGYRKGGYEAFIESEIFHEGLYKLVALARQKTSAIVCAERFPWHCHRGYISQKLEEMGFEVRHIIEKGRVWIPQKRLQPKLMF